MSKNKHTAQNPAAIRKRRIQRMKHFILFCAVFLLFASVILNLVLVFKVIHLEGQIDQLYSSTLIYGGQDEFF
ncbi:MAG: hypothetical protein PUC55_02225 [Lachnospiraceae bacterium]|nr:hypothetical protein [Lachnospiraceae bacterium]HCJ09139.1 hypothetical protein [Lachnospiraceae bacterium]